MGVLVCYDDFTYDVVNDYHLDHLLQTGCILGYDKSCDWVKQESGAARPATTVKELGISS